MKSHYKKEKDILLALSNDITKVRDKNDLITLFKKRIKGLYHITHTIVTLIDYKEAFFSTQKYNRPFGHCAYALEL